MGERHIIRDHRGRRVGLCDYKSLPPEMPVEMRNEVARAAAQQPRNMIWGLAGATIGVMVVPLLLRSSITVIDVLARVGGVAIVAGIVAGWWLWKGNTRAGTAIRRCITWGACPACGYPLAASKVEADGCRICSECGAAWRG